MAERPLSSTCGTFLTPQQVQAFLDKVPERVLVVLDEAYYEYADEAERGEAMALLSQYPNLIVSRTFSKAYGLAGLRVGYCACEKVRDTIKLGY